MRSTAYVCVLAFHRMLVSQNRLAQSLAEYLTGVVAKCEAAIKANADAGVVTKCEAAVSTALHKVLDSWKAWNLVGSSTALGALSTARSNLCALCIAQGWVGPLRMLFDGSSFQHFAAFNRKGLCFPTNVPVSCAACVSLCVHVPIVRMRTDAASRSRLL